MGSDAEVLHVEHSPEAIACSVLCIWANLLITAAEDCHGIGHASLTHWTGSPPGCCWFLFVCLFFPDTYKRFLLEKEKHA